MTTFYRPCFARSPGFSRFSAQVAWIAAAGWLVLAASSPSLGARSVTAISTTGTYTASIPSPDDLTTTGGNLKVTGGTATATQPDADGKVVLDKKSTSGATAVFVNRATGWGCFYSVNGVFVGSAGTVAATWQSWFTNDNSACITLEVNQPGPADNYVAYGGTKTLTVTVQGGSGSTNYTVGLSCSGNGTPAGNVTFSSSSVTVAGGGGSQTLSISGQTTGYVTITGTASNAATGTVNGAVVQVDIQRNGATISGETTSVMVGQHIVLKGFPQPAGVTVTSSSWTVPGTLVKSYTQTTASGGTAALSNADLSGGTIGYYWIAGGTGGTCQVVTYQAIAGGAAVSASTTFNVWRRSAWRLPPQQQLLHRR